MGPGKVNDMTRFRSLVLLSMVVLATAIGSWAGVFVSVAIGPPALPVYSQPIIPGPGYIWTPGYWSWSPDGYYWVPGTWVLPPEVGFLWTPGYWGFSAGLYYWHSGFWGPTVGFYGGVNYGFGYPGFGYYGGYWRGRDFYYNRTVNNVNITNVHNVYNQTVVNNLNVNRVSYNGGPHGVQARPTSEQLAAERGNHITATSAQVQHEQAARNDRAQFASVNHGRPAVVATPRPGAFTAREATLANHPNVNRLAETQKASRNAQNVPRPQNNQQGPTANNVPRPPHNNHPQERTAQNVPRPSNSAHQPQQHAYYAPPQQARQANHPPGHAAPEYRSASRPPEQQMMQRQPSPHQAPPQHQVASHQAPPQQGHQQQRPR